MSEPRNEDNLLAELKDLLTYAKERGFSEKLLGLLGYIDLDNHNLASTNSDSTSTAFTNPSGSGSGYLLESKKSWLAAEDSAKSAGTLSTAEDSVASLALDIKNIHIVAAEQRYIPILPHDILLHIMDFMDDGETMLHWLQALQSISYPSLGSLSLLLSFYHSIKSDQLLPVDFWPYLELDIVAADGSTDKSSILDSLKQVMHFFTAIKLDEELWGLEEISAKFTNTKPALTLSLDASRLTNDKVTLLGQCAFNQIDLWYIKDAKIPYPLFSSFFQYAWHNLSCLHLYECPGDIQFYQILKMGLEESKTITDFSILSSDLSRGGLEEIAGAVCSPSSCLARLQIRSCEVTVDSMCGLATHLAKSKLIYLDLEESLAELEGSDKTRVIEKLTDSIKESKSLCKLDLSSNGLTGTNLQYLINQLSNLVCLRELNLSLNTVEVSTIRQLMDVDMTSLKILVSLEEEEVGSFILINLSHFKSIWNAFQLFGPAEQTFLLRLYGN